MKKSHFNFTVVLLLGLIAAVPALAGDLYLNLIWHQHQPLYLDPETDQLRGPWVRTHATKDYYDMAAMHRNFHEVHATINLTSSLLMQLDEYYVMRIQPFLYLHEDGKWAVRAGEFLAAWEGRTDPWIDLALKPTGEFTEADRSTLLDETWNAFGISRIQMSHFPEYEALQDKDHSLFTEDDLTAVKAWFFLAHFDPDFLRGTALLDVDLSDLLAERDGRFYLIHPLTERDANRLVADAVRVMAEVIPVHKSLLYDPGSGAGQLEVITTPFYHPILPLLIDTDIAAVCQPADSLPERFAYPADAQAQVAKSVRYYKEVFGIAPRGMWPAEGSISEAAAGVFAENDINWICGDMQVLARSEPSNLPVAAPYRLQTSSGDIAVVFRETHLSDHIGFTYQSMEPDSAADHFLEHVLEYSPADEEPDRLLTVILDGENAWEWYEYDFDAKNFLRLLYEKLSAARREGLLTCVTPTEYFHGNIARGIPPHPVGSLTQIEKLWPGSWISANFNTWIGEQEENLAWEYLLKTRRDLEESGLARPDPNLPPPADSAALAVWKAYESVYAAEGSDWFWWYGADQSAGGGDQPFEKAFFSHLKSVYRCMREAGADVETPEFKPILSSEKVALQSGGTMAQGTGPAATVRFVCNAAAQSVEQAIYIAGNLPVLGEWQPNTVRMYDDGTHGDEAAGDGLWTLEVEIPVGMEVQYKYTNSGEPGVWTPSEEFAFSNRSFTVEGPAGVAVVRQDVFGVPE